MLPLIPLIMLGLGSVAWAFTRRDEDEQPNTGTNPATWSPRIDEQIRRSVEGDFSELPQIDLWLERTVCGGSTCIAGVTWPNGHYSEWRNSVEPLEVGFDVHDAFRAAQLIVAGGKKRTSPDKLPPEQALHRQRLSWRALKDAPEKERPKGWKLDGSAAALEAWWQAIGKDKRGAYKVRYAAIVDNAPATAKTDDQKNDWWRKLTKDQRGKYKDPYETSFLEDLGETLEDVATFAAPILEASAIQAADIIVPGSGQALKKGVSAAKQVAKDVKSAKATATAAVAKAKTVTQVAKTLASPTTQKALASVGVPAAATKKAAAMFSGIQNAAASVASLKSGNQPAALAYAKAAAAQATAANVPISAVREGGQKLYYLALTPGG